MYNIGICDDNHEICLQIKDAIKKYCRMQIEVVRINILHSGEEVFELFTDGYG
ncbi:hypothetical protein [Abyssisolibacter fermentans]|uniref:hypothetical protein n=1 Tax=Abyssisolibacter fermentans TaxID=1766203 RepID=UPI0012E337BC|nr:hypothetical protein [Abyssisolibacter fermentans]